MDISICIDHLGLNRNEYRLTQSVPPHSIAEWSGADPQPTQEQLETAWAEWQTEYDSQEYARNRKAEYPTTEELVVALWEAVIEERMASSIALQGKRTAIKEKYPK